jgi:hypothetical protein
MVRFFYFLLWVTMQYALRIYFKTVKTVHAPKGLFGRTIYVSNHAASFMDPLVVAGLNRPIVFFMTRSDVFTPLANPFLRSAHMLPIYRQQDGEDTKAKNDAVFAKCVNILNWGRNLLIFGEGFTDDQFVRRLKPVKKGAARIGFQTLESTNWEKKIYLAGIGCNYTHPNRMRSEILLETSDKICLNDYKEAYLQKPSKVINEVTKLLEVKMQECITHVKDFELCEAHENILMFSRKGMHPDCFDDHMPLVERKKHSVIVAGYINDKSAEIKRALIEWSERVNLYKQTLKESFIAENEVYEWSKKKSISKGGILLKLILLSPFAILGALHCYLPYIFVKTWVENSFRRPVFYGSVKLLLGMITIGLLNIPVIFLISHLFECSIWIGFAYYSSIGLLFLAFYTFRTELKKHNRRHKIKEKDLETLVKVRAKLISELKELVPLV